MPVIILKRNAVKIMKQMIIDHEIAPGHGAERRGIGRRNVRGISLLAQQIA